MRLDVGCFHAAAILAGHYFSYLDKSPDFIFRNFISNIILFTSE